ncbi:hypothetical protein WH47_02854 [Habropoda laboriosa]|uniref:RNA-directed RNA polymerase C-terminal domain-containing protein n=1 Tax=Habropoda laboriosa TaxID=597456 RepID=A0A0L7RHZ9_9HYME|nr:hypothetical protein WH47_02854 [Habropoda laboriosa]
MWDANSSKDKKEITTRWNEDSSVGLQLDKDEEKGHESVSVCLNYSGWDGTVSLEERIVEVDFISTFYPPMFRSAIMNCAREIACPITLNDDGDVWLRAGQRGSGELLTSLGNTVLVAANTAMAISECTGIDLRQVCSTIDRIRYKVGQRKENGIDTSVFKEIEMTRFVQLSDGDGTVIMTTEPWATTIERNIDEVLSLQ